MKQTQTQKQIVKLCIRKNKLIKK